MRERGVDHGLFLLSVFRKLYPQLKTSTALIKTRQVLPNASLPSNAARKGNSKDAFVMTEKAATKCLLIDDVYTTGATLDACKTALRKAGATEIHGFVLAKG